MNGEAASTRRRPSGWLRRSVISASVSCTDSTICLARVRNVAPSSVSSSRRVLRRMSVVQSLASSLASVRLVAEMVSPSCSAAAVMEPLSTTVIKACISSSVIFIFEFLSNIFYPYMSF